MSLFSKAESFLRASGYDVNILDERDFLIAKRPDLGGTDAITCIGIAENPPEASAQHLIVERFERVARRYPTATLKFLSGTTGGYQDDIRGDLRDLRVSFLTPALFFDTPFKYDYEVADREQAQEVADREQAQRERRTRQRHAASEVTGLAHRGSDQEPIRVKQPFVVSESGEEGDDLAEYLLEEVRKKSTSIVPSPTLWLVSAPAGYGKSFMFDSLFHKVYNYFQDEKKAQRLFPRPLPMTPEHLRKAAGRNINGLVNAFLQTDFAGHTPPELFSWMIDNGHGFWMTDGLDEVIASDSDFLDFILDRLTQPSSSSLILMSLRDSLLRSTEELHNWTARPEGVIRLIELKPWKRPQKRSFAWTKVHKRLPRLREKADDKVTNLIRVLTTNEHNKLSSTPFYAGMLADEFLAAASLKSKNEFDLLDSAVSEMCRREYDKAGPIQESVLPIETFRAWLEELAGEVVNQAGISIDDLQEFANHVEVFTKREIPPEERESLVKQLMVMPFLKTNQGRFEFTHEILGEFLAGSFYAKQMQADIDRDWCARYFDHLALQSDSMLLKVIAWIFREKRDKLVKAIQGCDSIATPGNVHRNIVQLLALMDNGRELLDRIGLSLERANLFGVQFGSMNLQGMSFVGSDLSFTDLSTCNLQGTSFESARLRDTLLPSRNSDSLQGATFDNMKNFVSIFERTGRGKNRLNSYDDFLDWATKATRVVEINREVPCPSARQLANLFGLFVFPNGEPRGRPWVSRQALLRQRQIDAAPQIRVVVDRMYEFGYLQQIRHPRNGASRPEIQDERYREIARFMRDSVLSQGLSDLLDDLCQIPDCRHI